MFLLLHAYALLKYLQSFMTRSEFRQLFVLAIAGAAGLVFLGVVGLTYLGQSLVRGLNNLPPTEYAINRIRTTGPTSF